LPNAIVQGPNNILYFTSNDPGLGRITTGGVVMTPVAPANTGALGNGMAAFGTAIWYASSVTNSIWRFNTVTSAFTEFLPPTAGSTYDVAVGANGIVWFTENGASKIGRLDPASGVITETALTREPRQITVATDGSVWFTERFAHAVGRLVPATNQVTEFAPFTGAPSPEGIAAAPDGSVWITQSFAGQRCPPHAQRHRDAGDRPGPHCQRQRALLHHFRPEWHPVVHRAQRERDRRPATEVGGRRTPTTAVGGDRAVRHDRSVERVLDVEAVPPSLENVRLTDASHTHGRSHPRHAGPGGPSGGPDCVPLDAAASAPVRVA
jgi:hypothetical protein